MPPLYDAGQFGAIIDAVLSKLKSNFEARSDLLKIHLAPIELHKSEPFE